MALWKTSMEDLTARLEEGKEIKDDIRTMTQIGELDGEATERKSRSMSPSRHQPTSKHAKVLGVVTSELDPSHIQDLKRPFNLAELKLAALRLNRNNAPGSDGIPIWFYRGERKCETPILLDLLNLVLEIGSRSASLREAHIYLIFKKGDGYKTTNCGPIFLLKADTHIFSLVIDSRLLSIIDSIVDVDQTEFLPAATLVATFCNISALPLAVVDKDFISGVLAQVDFKKAYMSARAHALLAPASTCMRFAPREVARTGSTLSTHSDRRVMNERLDQSIRSHAFVKATCCSDHLCHPFDDTRLHAPRAPFHRHLPCTHSPENYTLCRRPQHSISVLG